MASSGEQVGQYLDAVKGVIRGGSIDYGSQQTDTEIPGGIASSPEHRPSARTSSVLSELEATHGLTGLSHLLMGSVAEKVVRHAPVPVLIVRQDKQKS